MNTRSSFPSLYPWLTLASQVGRVSPLLLSRLNISGSIYLTLAIAVERYATVCHPYFRVSRLTAFIDYLSYHYDKKESVGGRKERGDRRSVLMRIAALIVYFIYVIRGFRVYCELVKCLTKCLV